jgi:DNA-binding HxlR family transcriptional regulator
MTNPQKFEKKSSCPAETTLKAISGRWKILILRELFQEIK